MRLLEVRGEGSADLDADQLANAVAMAEGLARTRQLAEQFLRLARNEDPIAAADPTEELSTAAFIAETVRFFATGAAVPVEVHVAAHLVSAGLPRIQLGRVIANLVINAIQAALEGSVVTVYAANSISTDRDGSRASLLKLVVSNCGPRICPEMRERIFEPNFTKRRGGSGLGLAIVRSIVAAAGGTVEVASRRDRTSFAVCLPVKPVAAATVS